MGSHSYHGDEHRPFAVLRDVREQNLQPATCGACRRVLPPAYARTRPPSESVECVLCDRCGRLALGETVEDLNEE